MPNRQSGLLVSLAIFLLLVLSLSEFGGTEIAGASGRFWRLGAVSLCFGLILVYATRSRSSKRLMALSPFFWGAGGLFAYMFFRALFDDLANYDETVKQLISTGLMFSLFIAVASRQWPERDLRLIGFSTLFGVGFVFTTWILEGSPFLYYSLFGWNPNGFGLVMMLSMMFLSLGLMQSRGRFAKALLMTGICLSAIMLLASTSRGPVAGIIATLAVYLLWPRISRSRQLYIWFSASFIMFCFAFPLIYLNLLSISQLEGATFFEKNLATRVDVYPQAMVNIARSPWFGEGIRSASSLFGADLQNPHNETLYLLMQGGFAELITYFFYLLSICILLFSGARDRLCRVSGAAFFGILFYSNFEQIMIINTVTSSLLAYLLIGIGISRGIDHRMGLYARHGRTRPQTVAT